MQLEISFSKMIGLGTIVNTIAIIIGSLIGIFVGQKLPDRVRNILVRAAGLIVIGIGIKMFFESERIAVVFFGLVFGGIVGELIGIESLLNTLGIKVKSLAKSESTTFLEGFVTTSLLYCVGPMAILGSIADGLNNQYDILFTKSILDGVTAIAFTASLGIGVLFSSLPVLIYQGVITVLAILLGNLFTTSMISELTATGGLLLAGIGINLTGVFAENNKLPIGNLLPAIVFTPLLIWFLGLFGF